MLANVSAEIVAIGTEILLGEITDTNSVFIARALRDVGVNVHFMTSVGDNAGRIAAVVRHALARANVVICCGGLGPTVDDMTRQGVADAVGQPLVFDEMLLADIAARFASFKVTMSDNNRRQAYIPRNAMVIPNPVGTAPAFWVDAGQGGVVCLPGVPREMKYLLAEAVLPMLRERFALGETRIMARVLHTGGIGESALDALIGDDLLNGANPTVGLAAHSGQIDVRITAKASTQAEAEVLIAGTEAQLRARIGHYVFGVDGASLTAALMGLLRAHDAQLAVFEAGVLDVLAAPLIAQADTQDAVAAITAYDTVHAAAQAMGGSWPTSLRALAEQSAQHVRAEANTTVGVAALSLPHAERDDHAAGTAIAVATERTTRVRTFGFGGQHEDAAQWIRSWGLSTAWLLAKEALDANAGH